MKKLLIWTLALAILALPAAALGDIIKDETIYAMLSAGGEAGDVLVVSHIETPEAGEYADFGGYSEVKPLTADVSPVIDGDTITWTLPENPEGFFAVGTMEGAQLPFSLRFSYSLDGEPAGADALAGQSGRITLDITVTANPQAHEYFRALYMAQIQVPLSLGVVSHVDAPGATSALVGQTQTLTYTVLPGQDAAFSLSFDALDFSMQSITIACAPMDSAGMLGIDLADISGQTQTLVEGAESLATGGQTFSDGIAALTPGLQQLTDAASGVSGGVAQLQDALSPMLEMMASAPASQEDGGAQTQSLHEGVEAYVSGANAAISGFDAISAALGGISENGASLSSGLAALKTGISPLIESLPEAQKTALLAQLDTLISGLEQYAQGIAEIAGQAAVLSQSVQPLPEAGAALATGAAQQDAFLNSLMQTASQLSAPMAEDSDTDALTQLADGAKMLADGMASLNEQAQALPAAAAELAQGQQALSEGIAQAIALLEDFPIADQPEGQLPSFASSDHTARSVQFVYQTAAIEKETPPAQPDADSGPKTFWERLVALF